MAKKQKIRVLVVEDDANWNDALCRMYEEILSPVSPVVESANSGPAAIRMIRSREFDLISCDINLGSTHPVVDGLPDRKVEGADGRKVLREVSEKQACNGVVVITGIDHDETISMVVPEKGELKRLKMNLDVYIDELFPDKSLCLKKDPDSTISNIQESIIIFKEVLPYERLIKLAEALPRLVPPYTIDLSAKYKYQNEYDRDFNLAPNIVIKSRLVRNVSIPIINKADSLFLYSLGKLKDTDQFYISKEFVCEIYNGIDADSCVTSARRRLKKLGLVPKELFLNEWKLGWKLNHNVKLQGFGDVDKRNPGSGGKYQKRDRINDIEDVDAEDPNDEQYEFDE